MVEKSKPERHESDGALSSADANFERVRQLTTNSAEAWLVANDAVVIRDALYDACFLFSDDSYHTRVTVSYARGHRLYEAEMTYRISARFEIAEGPLVFERSTPQTASSPSGKEQTMEHGTVTHINDCGTIIQIFLDTDNGVVVLAADGNLFRHAEADYIAASNKESLVGTAIEFVRNDWGGLESFAPIETEEARCLNCRRKIPPEYDAGKCVFGRHPKKG